MKKCEEEGTRRGEYLSDNTRGKEMSRAEQSRAEKKKEKEKEMEMEIRRRRIRREREI